MTDAPALLELERAKPATDSDHTRCCEVRAASVLAKQVALAEHVKSQAVAAWGLGEVRIRWFRPEEVRETFDRWDYGGVWWNSFEAPAEVSGLAYWRDPHTIWVKVGVRPEETAEIVGHELDHLIQFRTGGGGDEDRAYEAGRHVRDWHRNNCNCLEAYAW